MLSPSASSPPATPTTVLPASSVALQAIFASFTGHHPGVRLLDERGWTAFIRACPGLIVPPGFTEEAACQIFTDFVTVDDSNGEAATGLTFHTFVDSLIQLALERYPGDGEKMPREAGSRWCFS